MKSQIILVLSVALVTFVLSCSSTKPSGESENSGRPATANEAAAPNSKALDLDDGMSDLSRQISSRMHEGQKQKIAVIEFSELNGTVTDFGRFLSEELITNLVASRKFDVIERQLLNRILAEHKLTITGLIDESTAKQLGKILGADAICSGTVTDLVNAVKVNARLISTETGAIFAVAAVEIRKDEAIESLMNNTNAGRSQRQLSIGNSYDAGQRAQSIFYKEDFSNVPDGMLPENWIGGEKLCVKSDGRKRYLSEFAPANHKVIVNNVRFPENFEMKMVFQFAGNAGGNALYVYVGNIEIMIDVWSKYKMNDSYVDKQTRLYNQIVQAVLRKTGDVFDLIINNEKVLTGRYPNFSSSAGFSLLFHNMQSFRMFEIVGTTL